MDLVNLMYKYINRLINSDELLEKMNSLDLTRVSDDEKKNIESLIQSIENIKGNTPNEVDEFEKNRIKTIEEFIDVIDKALGSNNLDNETKEMFIKRKQGLVLDKEKVKDGGKLYEKIFTLLTHNDLIANYCKKMNNYELLEFIVQYISVPMPPEIDQKAFDELAQIAIDKDEREWLWRLAFNYNGKNKDFSLIEDYFIKVKDDYYLTELISAIQEDLDMKKLKKKVLNTKDNDFIEKVEYTLKNYSIEF